MKVYLAGSVPKGNEEERASINWRKTYEDAITKAVEKVELFDPSIFNKLEGDAFAVAGADSWNIQKSDVIVINAEEKLGAGTAMEFVIAKYFKKPVITVLPTNSHHRRLNVHFAGRLVEDWIHPFIELFSDIIVGSVDELEDAFAKIGKIKIKEITVIDKAIAHAKSVVGEK